MEEGPKLLLISHQIIPIKYKETQGNSEGECSSLSEVTEGFFPGTSSIIIELSKY